MTRNVFFITFFLFCQSIFGQADNVESAQLDFEPYVSSYLPASQGQLFFSKNRSYNQSFGSLNLDEIPIIDKYELLRQKVLHLKPRKRSHYSKDLYDPHAAPWEGFCNQWSAASLEPEIAKLLKELAPINCGGITLRPPEVRELLTAFYKHIDNSKFVGKRNRTPSAAREQYESLGYDDLPAHLFHTTLYENLKKNQGVIMDKSHQPDVMNHPIYKAQSVNLLDSQKSKVLPNVLPLEIVEAVDSDDSTHAILKGLQKAEAIIKERAENSIARQNRGANFFAKLSNETREHMQYLADFSNRKKRLFSSGKLHLKKGYSFKSIETSVFYKIEKEFADPSQDGLFNRNDYYSYVLIEKEGKLVNSMWISEPKIRPDFIWVPSQKITENDSFRKYSAEMDDLISIIEKCKPAQDVGVFYAQFNKASADGNIDRSEKQSLLEKWKYLGPVIDKEWIYSSLTNVKGISKEDLK